jgi:hypothetical protein
VEELMTDILEKLKSWDRCYPGNINIEYAVDEAIAEIERLRNEVMSDYNEGWEEGLSAMKAENERLREALKPFAYYADLIPDDIGDTASASGTVGDLRAAKAALEEK